MNALACFRGARLLDPINRAAITAPTIRLQFCPVCSGPLTFTRGSRELGFPRRLECWVHGYQREADLPKQSAPTVPARADSTVCPKLLPPMLKLPGFAFTDNELFWAGLPSGANIWPKAKLAGDLAQAAKLPEGWRPKRDPVAVAGRGWEGFTPKELKEFRELVRKIPGQPQYLGSGLTLKPINPPPFSWVEPSGWQSKLCEWPAEWAVDTITDDTKDRDEFLYFWQADLRHMLANPRKQSANVELNEDESLPSAGDDEGSDELGIIEGWQAGSTTTPIATLEFKCKPWILPVVEFYLGRELSTPLDPLQPYDWRMGNWLPKQLKYLCECRSPIVRLFGTGTPLCWKCMAEPLAKSEADLRQAENPWEAVSTFNGEIRWYSFLPHDKYGNPPKVRLLDLSQRTMRTTRSVHPISRPDGMEYLRMLHAKGELEKAVNFHEWKYCGARATELAPNNPDTRRRALNREAKKAEEFKFRPKGERVWPDLPIKDFHLITVEVAESPLLPDGLYGIKRGGNGVRRMIYLGPMLPPLGELANLIGGGTEPKIPTGEDLLPLIGDRVRLALGAECKKALATAKKEASRLKKSVNAEQRIAAQFEEIDTLYDFTFRVVGTCPVLELG